MAVWRVTIRGSLSGQEMAITRYWMTTFIPDNFQPFADALGNALDDTWAAAAHTDAILNDLYISQAPVGSLGFGITPADFPVAGTLNSADKLPNHDAVLCVYSSGSLSYPRQNRNRLGGAVESQVSAGVLNTTGQTVWEEVMQGLTTAIDDGDQVWTPVLWSDKFQASNTLTQRTVRAQISTQRTRRIGAGA